MGYKVVLFIGLLSICYGVSSQQSMTPEHLWDFDRVSMGELSPDGKNLIVSSRHYNIPSNSGKTTWYLFNTKTKKLKEIEHQGMLGSGPTWANANEIWFLTKGRNILPQIWSLDVQNGKMVQKSNFKQKISAFKLATNLKHLIAFQEVKTEQILTNKYTDLPLADARSEDDLMYRHWDHWEDDKKRHLFLYTILNQEIAPVGMDLLKGENYDAAVAPFGGIEQCGFSSDGMQVYYTAKKKVGKDYAVSTNSDVYKYDISSGETTNISEGNLGYDMWSGVSPEGAETWLSMKEDGFESDKNDIILNMDGTIKNLSASIDVTVSEFKFHPTNGLIYFIAPYQGTMQVFSLNPRTGTHLQVSSGQFNYTSLEMAENKIYATRQSMLSPTEIVSIDLTTKKIDQITHFNKDKLYGLDLPEVKKEWVETTDGKKMLVWAILPPNFDSSKKYPTLLYCQGGPQSMVSQFFSYRWNFALMASQGYVVVAPNRRGLPGFGKTWNDAISKDWGGQAIQDYLSAIDHFSEKDYVDESKLGAVGASYGGYSVYYLAGMHNKRFKTFISHCGLFNLESWYGTTEELFFANHDIGGPYWDKKNTTLYAENSPHKMVDQWDTPILVIHGGKDFRVPVSEGMQAFQAAQLKGLRSKFLYFPEEGHWILSPQNGILWQREFFEWLDQDLKAD